MVAYYVESSFFPSYSPHQPPSTCSVCLQLLPLFQFLLDLVFHPLTSFSVPPVLPGLYPNLEELGDYMGLALNSDEVQKNLALVPVADNVSIITVCVLIFMLPHYVWIYGMFRFLFINSCD